MTLFGILHFVLMLGSLGLGVVIFLIPKGTPRHKRLGRFFVAGMMLSNVVVLGLYKDTNQPGIFHFLAILSLVSLVGAIALVRMPGANTGRRIAHGHVMLWSYGGVVAAGLGQSATALNFPPWPIILMSFLVVALIAYRTNFAGVLDGR